MKFETFRSIFQFVVLNYIVAETDSTKSSGTRRPIIRQYLSLLQEMITSYWTKKLVRALHRTLEKCCIDNSMEK
eukprot:8673658-Ditylum_brightwellii.AAC.1